MAAYSMPYLAIGSDEVMDYICSSCTCMQVDAEFYCKTCLKLYCVKCIKLHEERKHATYDKNNMKEWPVSKQVEEFLLQCEAHNDKQINKFCYDHSQLCCMLCEYFNHSQCTKVAPISQLTNTPPTDLQRLSVELKTVHEKIKSLQSNQEASVQSLKRAYKENEALKVEQMRLKINTCIKTEKWIIFFRPNINNTIKTKNLMGVFSILNEFEKNTVKELEELKSKFVSQNDSLTSSISKCTSLRNDLTKCFDAMKEIRYNKELCSIFSIKSKQKIQEALNMLGKLDHILTVQGKSEYNVHISSDKFTCRIAGICVLPNGQVLVTDSSNRNVKLLNQHYHVVSHSDVGACPEYICQITPREVAVTLYCTNEVQFITVNESQLVPGRKFQLQHKCFGIAHHQDDLFIISDNALYKYTLSGKLVRKLYEYISDEYTVWGCAVSPTGENLYIINRSESKLLTLTRDGNVLASFEDQQLQDPYGVQVTPAGQVLIYGGLTNTILQVDNEGRRKLASLVTQWDGVVDPESVFYSSTSSSIIVGKTGNSILVFKVLTCTRIL